MKSGMNTLIPRDLLFGNPERTSPRLSPDGSRLAWLAPDSNNVLQVWMKSLGTNEETVVTTDKKRGIQLYFWAKDNRTLLYVQDRDGDENYHLYGVDLLAGNVRDFTPFEGVRVAGVHLEPDFPNFALVWLNRRDRSLFDVHRLNLRSGELNLDTPNPGDVGAWVADAQFRVRAAQAVLPDAGNEIRVRADESAPWKTFLKAGPDEILTALGFTADGQSLYLKSSLRRDTAAVVEKNIGSGAEKVVAACDEVDADEVLIHPKRHVVEAVAFSPGRRRWQTVDPAVKEDFVSLARLDGGDFSVVNRTESDEVWLVAYTSDRASRRFYRWDRRTKQGIFLFSAQPRLDGLPLAEMKPVVIVTRDGLKMNSYLTLPAGGFSRESADGFVSARRPVVSGCMGLQQRGPVARQPGLRGAPTQFPGINRLWEELSQCRKQTMGAQDARRSH